MNFADILRQATSEFVSLSDEQVGLLEAHYQLLVAWNKRLNLTRVIDLPAAVIKHYAESLFLAAHIPAEVRSVVDIGSGAGFPGVPLAAARPDLSVTLCESDIRKAVFLRESTAGISNIAILNTRSEKLSGYYNLIVSRAVAPEEIASLVLRIAPAAMMLANCSTWNVVKTLPWNPAAAIVRL